MKKLLLALPILLAPVWAGADDVRRELAFVHTHTGESVSVVYKAGDRFVPEGLASLNQFLRDHRSGDVTDMDPAVFDVLYELREAVGGTEPFHLISGYRSPKTNEMLRAMGRNVAKRSQHMEGRAIDVRLPGVDLSKLHETALAMQRGGVGYYPGSDFIHVDTGRVRSW